MQRAFPPACLRAATPAPSVTEGLPMPVCCAMTTAQALGDRCLSAHLPARRKWNGGALGRARRLPSGFQFT